MNPFSTTARYFAFDSSVPVDFGEGHVSVGGAVGALGERLTAVRVFNDNKPELLAEYWLTERETVELAERLLAMESWFRPEKAESPADRGGEAE